MSALRDRRSANRGPSRAPRENGLFRPLRRGWVDDPIFVFGKYTRNLHDPSCTTRQIFLAVFSEEKGCPFASVAPASFWYRSRLRSVFSTVSIPRSPVPDRPASCRSPSVPRLSDVSFQKRRLQWRLPSLFAHRGIHGFREISQRVHP